MRCCCYQFKVNRMLVCVLVSLIVGISHRALLLTENNSITGWAHATFLVRKQESVRRQEPISKLTTNLRCGYRKAAHCS